MTVPIIRGPSVTPQYYVRAMVDDLTECQCGMRFTLRHEAQAHRRQTKHRGKKVPNWHLKDPETLARIMRREAQANG